MTLAVAPLATALPLKTQLEQRQTPCASGVHIIVARASNEPPGEGIIGPVASMVEARIPGSDSEAIVYPALLLPYMPSEDTGTTAMLVLSQATLDVARARRLSSWATHR